MKSRPVEVCVVHYIISHNTCFAEILRWDKQAESWTLYGIVETGSSGHTMVAVTGVERFCSSPSDILRKNGDEVKMKNMEGKGEEQTNGQNAEETVVEEGEKVAVAQKKRNLYQMNTQP